MSRDDDDDQELSGTDRDGGFVDRDDDGRRDISLTDSDDDSGLASGNPDPGFAAFADDFDDPLADWPGPEPLAPEKPETPDTPDTPEVPDDASDAAALPVMEVIEDELPLAEPHSFSAAAAAPEFVDNDEAPAPPAGSGGADDRFDMDRADDRFDLDRADDRFDMPGDDDPLNDPFDNEPVDDFLNDLDPPEAEYEDEPALSAGFDIPDFPDPPEDPPAAPPENSDIPPAPSTGADDDAAPVRDAAPDPGFATAAATMHAAGDGEDRGRAPAGGGARELADAEDTRRLPIAMLAVVAVALVLLAVGGYGVVQQRSAMQEEIRDLQARLATAMTPQESAAIRERQQDLVARNDTLSAEVDTLRADNARLADVVAGLESAVAAEKARADEQQQAAAKATAAAAAAREQARTAAATPPGGTATRVAEGPWFVNFGSYAKESVAKDWAQRLDVADGRVEVQSASAGGRTVYRVRVVGLASQDAAERVATQLERTYQLPRLWVGTR
jgi:uncharacterized protein YoxC